MCWTVVCSQPVTVKKNTMLAKKRESRDKSTMFKELAAVSQDSNGLRKETASMTKLLLEATQRFDDWLEL